MSIAGGEPLLHKDMPQIVEGIVARRKFAILCTNALLLEKKIDQFKPSPYFMVDPSRRRQDMHDKSVCQDGVYDRAVSAIKLAKSKGFRVTINCTFFPTPTRPKVAAFFDTCHGARRRWRYGVAGLRLRARARPAALPQPHPDQEPVPRRIPRAARAARSGRSTSPACSSTSSPATRPINARPGASRPARSSAGRSRAICSAKVMSKTFTELMEDTDWDAYGIGNYEKCANCMVHCGYEPTAVADSVASPGRRCGSRCAA